MGMHRPAEGCQADMLAGDERIPAQNLHVQMTGPYPKSLTCHIIDYGSSSENFTEYFPLCILNKIPEIRDVTYDK